MVNPQRHPKSCICQAGTHVMCVVAHFPRKKRSKHKLTIMSFSSPEPGDRLHRMEEERLTVSSKKPRILLAHQDWYKVPWPSYGVTCQQRPSVPDDNSNTMQNVYTYFVRYSADAIALVSIRDKAALWVAQLTDTEERGKGDALPPPIDQP